MNLLDFYWEMYTPNDINEVVHRILVKLILNYTNYQSIVW